MDVPNPKEILEKYKTYISIFFIIAIIVVLLFYITSKTNLKQVNCRRIEHNKQLNLSSMSDSDEKLNNFFIKTAYNCCCTGNFKNDYVDLCSLKNCATQGVRALDFQIYSLNNKPVISASSVKTNKYKEIYNYLEFYDTMLNIKRYFIDDPTTSSNNTDPLFLIFRLYSTNQKIYDDMGDALNNIFGFANSMGNLIYIAPPGITLDNESLNNLRNKVIIIVDPANGDPPKFESSKLNWINSLTVGTGTNNAYNEKDSLINVSSIHENAQSNLTFLYPEISYISSNYDFVTTGIFNYISFICMSFQTNDKWLTNYNSKDFFGSNAFISKTEIITNMASNTKYSTQLTKYNALL